MLEEIFAPGAQYYEIILGGCIGSGKSTSAALAYVYLLYKISCLKNPATYYNLVERSRIVFGVYSMTKRLVADVGYGRIRSFVERMPYFKTKFPHDRRILSKINFKKADISVVYGCVAEGTVIMTPDGGVPIEKLTDVSSEVLTSDGSAVFSSGYKGVKYSGVKKCLEITTESSESVVVSYDHKFIVEDSNGNFIKKKAGELKEGGAVFVLRRMEGDTQKDYEVHKVSIKSIRDAGLLKTYDVIEVPGTHNVFTNNLLTSNSQEFHVLGQDVFCVAEGTKVQTSRGLKSIENINIADDVVTPIGNRSFSDIVYTGEKECVEIELDNNINLITSVDHLFLTISDCSCNWTRASDLTNDDSIVSIETINNMHSEQYTSLINWLKLCAKMQISGITIMGASFGTCLTEHSTVFQCVKSIKKVGLKPCYDILNVAEMGCYALQGGVISHNSMYMDEVNFMQDKVTAPNKAASMNEELGQAQEIYNAARSRIKSRYMRPGGSVPGMTFLLSSKTSKHSFLERHVQKIRPEIEAKLVFLAEYALWEVKPAYLYVKPKFKVQIGNALVPSKILEEFESPKDGTEVIEVPGEFKDDFERNTERALREVAGRATVGISPLFRDKQAILNCVDNRKHPFTQDVVHISVLSDIEIIDYLEVDTLFRIKDSDYIPRLNPGSPRAIHLDLARKKDAAGFCMSHIGGLRQVKKMRYDGTYYFDKEPVIIVDIALAIKLRGEGEIDFSKIRAFILALREYGYPITTITADKYQSADTLQIFTKLGYETAFLSVDERPEPYHYTRQAFIEDRIRIYNYPILIRELGDLEEDLDSGVIDHPDTASDGSPGTKDVADSLSGTVFTLMNAKKPKGVPAGSSPTSAVFPSDEKRQSVTVRGEMKISLDQMADEVIKYINLNKGQDVFEGLRNDDDNKKS